MRTTNCHTTLPAAKQSSGKTPWQKPSQVRLLVQLLMCSLFGLIIGGCAMVGPDFIKPEAPVADTWATQETASVVLNSANKKNAVETEQWWLAFNDPILNALIERAYLQNLDLKIAGLRILEARARLGISTGNLYPQQQSIGAAFGAYGASENGANTIGGDLNYTDGSMGFDAAWELDFWGKFRRGVQAADANLLASIADYDSFLGSLTAEVARTYVLIRTMDERIYFANSNVTIQQRSEQITNTRFKGGLVTELDVQQARNLLANTQAVIPVLKASRRQAKNSLAILLGIPPQQIDSIIAPTGKIPQVPTSIAVGIPAELLRRRPDVRQAELQALAQSSLIGVAKADLYPHFTLLGSVGLRASDSKYTSNGSSSLSDMFESDSVEYFAGPAVSWDILNYGRIKNEIRVQDARLQQALTHYQNTVLRAAEDVENALVGLVNNRQQLTYLHKALAASQRSVDLAMLQYREGLIDFQRVLDTQRGLSTAQDKLTETRGSEALNMIGTYKALGGGWQIRNGQSFVDDQTRQQMTERTDWGGLLEEKQGSEQTTDTQNNK